jgi:hypothetical protein
MGRKPRNQDWEESIDRVSNAIQNPKFIEGFQRFEADWARAGFPSIGDDRVIDWDNDQHRAIYSGLYYDLRELCDRFGLYWSIDAEPLMRLLYAHKTNDDSLLTPAEIPSERDWQWFRVARTGLGLPREDEITRLREIGKGLSPHTQSNRSFERGFTHEDIAEMDEVTERTVRDAINRCWTYLQAEGVNLNQVAELAGLQGDEIIRLAIAPLIREYNKAAEPEK